MRVFMTGATGFVGSHLIQRMRCPTVALVRDQMTFLSAGFKVGRIPPASLVCGDLSDIALLERVLAEYQIDTVYHLAAQTEVRTALADPVGTFETNIRGTWNLLEACRRQKVGRVIVSSSDKAYGRTAAPYTEDSVLAPDRPYEASKACADILSRTYASAYGMSVAVTRCVNIYGPECMTLSTLVPNTIKRILRGEPPIIRGGGKMRRDWLYIDDAVEGYARLAGSDYTGAINFGSGKSVSVREVVDLILDLMESKLKPIDEPDKTGELVDQWADASLAKRVLDWKPAWKLRDGLEQTIRWYRANYAPRE